MRRKKSEEDFAIAELLEPLLQQQRASDYADLLKPPAVDKPLLNNEWVGLAEKVWAKFEKIFFLVIIRLFTSENYLEANVDPEDTKAIWKVVTKVIWKVCSGMFFIQSGKSIECTVDPVSLKASGKISSEYKRGYALHPVFRSARTSWNTFVR